MNLYTDYASLLREQETTPLPKQFSMSQLFAKRLRTFLINEDSEEALFFYDVLYAQKDEATVFLDQHQAYHLKEFLHGAME